METPITRPLIIILSLLWLSACESDGPSPEMVQRFDTSRLMWADLEAEAGGHYWYRADHFGVSQWTSSAWVEVEDGEVVRVEREIRDEVGNLRPNASDFVELAPAVTIDRLYDLCRSVLNDGGMLTFEVRDDGLLSVCSAYPEGCYDDCGRGVKIDDFGEGAMPR